MGFELNPYDLCVTNKTINSQYYTIFSCISQIISHKYHAVVDNKVKKYEHILGNHLSLEPKTYFLRTKQIF